ncbi:uncharacterized protein LOC116424646 [Nomia melanderi]|uniref:uncharacterized protein LOC116424646 n=1 Tax=Nomia melanderi TaxID=2448451 RepID=UPI003FCC7A66
MQTQPSAKLLRHPQQPRIVTRIIDPEPEILERLTRWRESQQPTTTTTTATSQTEKSSFLRILQTLRSSGAYSKLESEKELKSIHYQKMKRTAEAEARCNCCLCGKTVPDTIPCEKPLEAQTSSVMRLLQALPLLGKAAPGVDQAVQHESFCPECKLKKLGFQPKVTQTTRDQEVNVCGPTMKRLSATRPKQKSDESCMARIRVEKFVQRELVVQKMSVTKSVQETTVATSVKDAEDTVEDEKEQEEYKDSVDCMCSSMGSETGGGRRVRCGCGDPD